MKKLLIIFTLLFSVMFSFSSFAEWEEVSENLDGVKFYVNFETIKKYDGYTYVWYTGACGAVPIGVGDTLEVSGHSARVIAER